MTTISEKDIEGLAELARMKLTDEERANLGKDLNNILGYVESIQGVEADTASNKGLVDTVLRDDATSHESGAYTDQVLQAAPDTQDGYVKVPKILSNNDE